MTYLETTKKHGEIIEQLRDGILSGKIPGGREMTQQELAEGLGVSRMPVREALTMMEFAGMVVRLPNNHIKVAEISEDFFREIFDLCAFLEYEILEKEQIPMENVDEMNLHRMIYGQSNNSFIRRTLQTIVENYVDYAVNQDDYDREKGLNLLRLSLTTEGTERKGYLENYFRNLTEILTDGRK